MNNHIKLPYILHFKEPPKIERNVLGKLPHWSKFELSIATDATIYQFPKAVILTQAVRPLHFHVNVTEFHTDLPLEFEFEVKEDQLFLLFMWEGSLKFSTTDGRYITNAQFNHYYLSYNGPGMFKASMTAGKHTAIVVAIKVNWAKKVFKEFSNLAGIIKKMLESPEPYNIMPHFQMDKQIHEWLKKLYATTENNTAVLDSFFRMYITLMLGHYNELLASGEGMLAYKVKQYLDLHYTDLDISYNKLETIFSATERTLRNQFKKEFHITMHDYYTRLRMEMAQHLIKVQMMPISEIYLKVGYNDERSFRHAYKKFSSKNASK